MNEQKNEWHKEFFHTLYYELFLKRTDEQSLCDANKIQEICNIKQPSLILEQCCGVGDVAHQLANLGHQVYAIDYSKEYIDIGVSLFKNVNFVCDNALTYQFKNQLGKFDYVTNWYSSFGYFEHENNLKLIQNAYQHLKKGGLYLIDMYNTISIIKNFKSLFEYHFSHSGKEIYVKRSSQINLSNMSMYQIWEYFFDGSKKHDYEHHTTLELYMAKDMIQLLKLVGFESIDLFDEFHKPFNLESNRLKIIARK